MSKENKSKQKEPTVLEQFTSKLSELEDKYLRSKRVLTQRRISEEEIIENPLLPEFTEIILPIQGHSLDDYVGRLDSLMNPDGKEDFEIITGKYLAVNLHSSGGLNILHSSTNNSEIIDQYLGEVLIRYNDSAKELRKLNETIKDAETGEDKIVGKYSEQEIHDKLIPQFRSYLTLKQEAKEQGGNDGLNLFKEIRLRYTHKKEEDIVNLTKRNTTVSVGILGALGIIATGIVAYNLNDSENISAQALADANQQIEVYQKAQTDAGALGQLVNSHKLRNAEDFAVVQDTMNCYALHNGGSFEFENFGGLLEKLVGPYKLSSSAEQNVLSIVTENGYDGSVSSWDLDQGYDTCLKLE